MYLKHVTIHGFKSFADKTQFPLTTGITCIVGPNGCGKSNIVDAIRWVLGEQSAKALRGGKMQDVIFQGTETRKPIQFCEVKLLFSDCEKQLGTAFNEVEITRRVTRDGGSDYYINGKLARLKDIQNLFMDTGIGRVSYSFMVQGQIDQILSSNPSERRSIFEEAAGITKYKTQRREALNKLTLVDQNLARATDRIEEISRQIGTLKRQASKALRFKRLSFKLRHLDLALNAKNYTQQSAQLSGLQQDLNKITSEIFELNKKLSAQEEKLNQMRVERTNCNAKLDYLRQNAAEVRSQKEQAQSNSSFAITRKQDLLNRLEQISSEIDNLNNQLLTLEGKAEGDIQEKQLHLNLVSEDDQVFKLQCEQLEEIAEELNLAQSKMAQAKQDTLNCENAIARLRSNCTTLEVDLKSYQVRHASIADSIYQLKEENLTLQNRKKELSSALEFANERLATSETEIAIAKSKYEELILQYRNKQVEIQQMDRQLASKTAKLGLLNDFQSRMEGVSDGVKAILKGQLNDIISPDDVQIISQNLEVVDGWTNSFETMLGNSIDSIAFSDDLPLANVLNSLQDRNLGSACLQTNYVNFDENNVSLPANIYRGSDIVKSQDTNIDIYAKNILTGCYFCEDIFDFIEFTKNNTNFKFLIAVSKDGVMLDAKGMVYAPSSEKRNAESSFIVRNQEIKRLKDEIQKDNDSLTTFNESAMQIQSLLDDNNAQIDEYKNTSSEIKREISSINGQFNSIEQTINEKLEDIQKKSSILSEMENSRFEAQDKLNSATIGLNQSEQLLANSRAIADEKEAEIAQLRELKDQKNSIASETRLKISSKKSMLESLERGLGAIKQQQEETKAVIEKRKVESQSVNEQIATLENQTKAEKNKAETLANSLEEILETIEVGKAQFNECEAKILEFEKSLTGDRESLMHSNNFKNQCDLNIAKLKAKTDYIAERIFNEYEISIDDVDWKIQLWKSEEEFELKIKLDELEDGEIAPQPKQKRGEPTQEDFDNMDNTSFTEIEEEVRDIRERINAMGAVNLVAIEEYAQLKERYDFLKTQTEDLWTSKNELTKNIDEINATSQKMFEDTFEQIKKNFEFTFQKVFAGGTADLKLVETEDVLDSGIEIIARPPGTLLKSLSLLSGGQRTMTAVSLLFAIYMVKPSPFCVLDELDAPLDDANIGRYTDLLKEFIKYSQFLVISHNKRTMSAAQTIYGVTMQERGVTNLISMKLKEAETIID